MDHQLKCRTEDHRAAADASRGWQANAGVTNGGGAEGHPRLSRGCGRVAVLFAPPLGQKPCSLVPVAHEPSQSTDLHRTLYPRLARAVHRAVRAVAVKRVMQERLRVVPVRYDVDSLSRVYFETG